MKTRAVRVAAQLFPGWYGPALRGWSKAAIPARAKSQPQNTFLRATIPRAGARFRCAYAKDVRLLLLHRRAHACIRCSAVNRLKWKPSPGWWCDLQSVSESIPPRHESAENDWSGPYLRGAVRAAGARSQYMESRTGWPRTAQKRLRAWLSPCSVRTYTHSPPSLRGTPALRQTPDPNPLLCIHIA